MRKLIIFLFTVASLSTVSTTQANDLASVWNQDSIVVDGWANEWKGQDYLYFDDNNSALAVRNDAVNLYVILLTRERAYLPGLIQKGLTFWVNDEGNKDKGIGIEYRAFLKQTRKDQSAGRQLPAGGDMPFDRDTSTTFVVHLGDERIEVSEKEFPNLEVAARIENGAYACELRIPLALLADHGINVEEIKEDKLGLGIESGEFERPELDNRSGFGRLGGMRSGSGVPNAGQGRFGSRGRRDFQRPRQLEEWVKISPAQRADSLE